MLWYPFYLGPAPPPPPHHKSWIRPRIIYECCFPTNVDVHADDSTMFPFCEPRNLCYLFFTTRLHVASLRSSVISESSEHLREQNTGFEIRV